MNSPNSITNLTSRGAAAALLLAMSAMTAFAQPSHTANDGHIHTEHAAAVEKAGVMPTVAQGIMPMLVTIIVFIVVLVILSKMVWPKINAGLREREDKIRSEIAAAEMARSQANDALAQYNKSLAEARAEAQRMIDATKASQSALAAELRAKADVELGALRDRAMRDIDAARKAAVAEIYSETATLAANVAAKILKREINPGDQHRLVEESLGEMQTLRA